MLHGRAAFDKISYYNKVKEIYIKRKRTYQIDGEANDVIRFIFHILHVNFYMVLSKSDGQNSLWSSRQMEGDYF